MKKLTTVYIGLILSISITSCNIEKRTYMKGYHIGKINHKTVENKSVENNINFNESTEKNINTEEIITESLTASVDNSLDFTQSKKTVINFNKTEKKLEEECDIIILKDGKEIKAKVLEITTSEIKYKECSNLNGPIFTKTKSDVFMVKYPNGTNTVMTNDENKVKNNNEQNSNSNSVVVNINNNSKGNTTNKSKLVAIILCLFAGIIGIHRFYLGYIGIGIIQFLTLGFFGIWFLIDLIRLLTGSLKPKNGEYKD